MQNLLFFEGNKPYLVLEINFDKVVIVGGAAGVTNNTRFRGWSPQLPEANWGSGAETPRR